MESVVRKFQLKSLSTITNLNDQYKIIQVFSMNGFCITCEAFREVRRK